MTNSALHFYERHGLIASTRTAGNERRQPSRLAASPRLHRVHRAALLRISALMLVLSPGSGAVARRIGPRLQLITGPLLLAVAMGLMAFIDARDAFAAANVTHRRRASSS